MYINGENPFGRQYYGTTKLIYNIQHTRRTSKIVLRVRQFCMCLWSPHNILGPNPGSTHGKEKQTPNAYKTTTRYWIHVDMYCMMLVGSVYHVILLLIMSCCLPDGIVWLLWFATFANILQLHWWLCPYKARHLSATTLVVIALAAAAIRPPCRRIFSHPHVLPYMSPKQ